MGILTFSSLLEELCPEQHILFKAFYIFTDIPYYNFTTYGLLHTLQVLINSSSKTHSGGSVTATVYTRGPSKRPGFLFQRQKWWCLVDRNQFHCNLLLANLYISPHSCTKSHLRCRAVAEEGHGKVEANFELAHATTAEFSPPTLP